MLDEIKCLVMEVYNLQHKLYKINHDNNFKCEHYDDYEVMCKEVGDDLENKRKLLEEKCNSFIDYPEKKFLFFTWKNKVEFKERDFLDLVLIVPFVDKKEYFCLVSLFENLNKYMFKWRHDMWILK